jgi:hypothetical protein
MLNPAFVLGVAVVFFLLAVILLAVVNIGHYYATSRMPDIRRTKFIHFLKFFILFLIANLGAYLLAVRFYMLFHGLG